MLKPFQRKIVVVLLFGSLATGAELIRPIIYRWVIDHAVLDASLTSDQRIQLLTSAGLALCLALLLGWACDFGRLYQSAVLNYQFTAKLRGQVLRRLLRFKLGDLDNLKTGGASARLNHDTSVLSQVVDRALLDPATALLQIVSTLAVIFLVNRTLFVIGLAVVVPLAVVTHFLSAKARPYFDAVLREQSRLSARTVETFSGMTTTRIHRRENERERTYVRTLHRLIRHGLKAKRYQIVLESGWIFLGAVIQLVVIVFGGYLVIKEAATIGDVMAITILAVRLFGPFRQLARSFDQVQENFAALHRVDSILEHPTETSGSQAHRLAPARVQSLELRALRFRHPGNESDTLKDVSARINGGQTVAIVGPSGAGKTTLLELLARLREPDHGQILVNGVATEEITLSSYRELVGMVEQEVFLFSGSIGENIRYGRPQASDIEVEKAARRANAHHFIDNLPDGYATEVGERGGALSGGERQRIGLARAFLVDPPILLLDEATSHLDVASEEKIRQALTELVKDRTTFIVAHRLSTITNADLILVMEDGRICESGTHADLLARRGAYTRAISLHRNMMKTAGDRQDP